MPQVILVWEYVRDDEAPEDGFIVFRKVAGGAYAELGRTTKYHYTDGTVQPGYVYQYAIRPYNQYGKAQNLTEITVVCIEHLPADIIEATGVYYA